LRAEYRPLISSDSPSRILTALRRFGHWFAHLMDDREPSRRTDPIIRDQEGEVKMNIPPHHEGTL